MNKIILLFSLLLFNSRSFGQKLVTYKDHCGLYYKSIPDLLKQKQKEIGFYSFQPGQNIASIGAQCCHWEAAFAAVVDSLNFYLQDIDSTYFNQRQAAFAWNHYAAFSDKIKTSPFTLVLGDEKQTKLPDRFFDKILIINSFHEFSDQPLMLKDISLKLKAGGLLYIDEALARKTGELHGVCRKRIFLDEELIGLMKANGFDYVDGLNMNFRKSVPVRKIFAFRRTTDTRL